MRIRIPLREDGETLIHGASSQNRATWRNTCGWRYRISGNFRVTKGSREKISRSKIFAVWAFHENLTRGENVEEYGHGRDWCIRGCHVYHEIWEQLLEQLHYGGRRTCQFRPEQSRLYCPYGPGFPLDAVRTASSTSRFAAAIA